MNLERVHDLLSIRARNARWRNSKLVLRCRSQFLHSLPRRSDHGDDACFSKALPGQTQHQGVKLNLLQAAVGFTTRSTYEFALMQSARGQPDTDAVVHEYLEPVGPLVGEQVGVVGVGCAEDGDHPGQCRVGSGPHFQWGSGQPSCFDVDHLRRTVVQLARSAAAFSGHETTIDKAPWRSSILISCYLCTGVTEGNASGMNAGAGDGVTVMAATQGSAS